MKKTIEIEISTGIVKSQIVDTATEAIKIAKEGKVGIIKGNFTTEQQCINICTVKKYLLENPNMKNQHAMKCDDQGRLLVGVVIDVGPAAVVRAGPLVNVGLDFFCIDDTTNKSFIGILQETIKILRARYPHVPVVCLSDFN